MHSSLHLGQTRALINKCDCYVNRTAATRDFYYVMYPAVFRKCSVCVHVRRNGHVHSVSSIDTDELSGAQRRR